MVNLLSLILTNRRHKLAHFRVTWNKTPWSYWRKQNPHKSHYLCDSEVVLPSSFSCINSPLVWSVLNFL